MISPEPNLISEVTIEEIKIELQDEELDNDAADAQEQLVSEPSVESAGVTKCEKCNQFFDSKRGIKNHVIRCKGPDPDGKTSWLYNCEICSVPFRFRESLLAHLNKHKGIKPFKCRVQCDQHFHGTALRTMHEKRCQGMPQTCQFCNAKVSNPGMLVRHMSYHHSDAKYECNICGKKFAKNHRLKLHERKMHSNEKPKYSCEVCGKKFKEARFLQRHMGLHMEEKPFKCELCNAGLSSQSTLNIHMTITHGKAILQCKTCGSKFKTSSIFYSHRRVVHKEVFTKEKMLRERSVSDIRQEIGRKLAHTDFTELLVAITECKTCHRFFESKEGIISHEVSCNELNEAPDLLYTCHLCTISFRTVILLSAHLKEHKDGKLLKCRVVCEKWFYVSQKRDDHEKVCGLDKYSCLVCDSKLANQKSLWKHMNTVHVEAKHKCETCGKMFKRRTDMIVHQRTFHSENPPKFTCEICEKDFTHAQNLWKHMEKHVKSEPC